MKSVFILNDRATGGGAESVMRDIVKYLHNNYAITIMTLDDDYEAIRRIFPADVKYIPSKIKRNRYKRGNPLRYLVWLHNLIRSAQIYRQKYDIVIANKEGPCMKIVSQMRAEKKLAWVHVDYRYLYWTRGTFSAEDEVECMKRFNNVVCVSDAARDGVKSVIGDPGNLCVRYNPLDYLNIKRNAQEAKSVERDNNKPLFVAVGRFEEQKNFIALAKVCARLSKEFDFETWLVGDGSQRKDIEQVLNEENCTCVKILGMQSNPHKFLAKADLLISTAVWESYGLVIQEAQVLGVPVLTTRCPAIEECFDTKFGMLVDCDEKAIEKAMRSVLENPRCIDEYKKVIKDEYDAESLWDKRLKEIEGLILQ